MTDARSIRRRVFLATLFGAIAGVPACFGRRTSSLEEDDSDAVTIRIVNHHRLNVTIFNVAQGRRDRMGEVTAAASANFTLHLRRFVGSELQLLADAVGSPETVRSEVLHLAPGDVVEWTLETDLARSHLMLR
jgi:hypothetical protein